MVQSRLLGGRLTLLLRQQSEPAGKVHDAGAHKAAARRVPAHAQRNGEEGNANVARDKRRPVPLVGQKDGPAVEPGQGGSDETMGKDGGSLGSLT